MEFDQYGHASLIYWKDPKSRMKVTWLKQCKMDSLLFLMRCFTENVMMLVHCWASSPCLFYMRKYPTLMSRVRKRVEIMGAKHTNFIRIRFFLMYFLTIPFYLRLRSYSLLIDRKFDYIANKVLRSNQTCYANAFPSLLFFIFTIVLGLI